MFKRNYTHIKELLPSIQTMVAERLTQREIAEHYVFKDKLRTPLSEITSTGEIEQSFR